MPCHAVPHSVVSTPSASAVPPTRFTPANRAPNRLRGAANTAAAEPVSAILPDSRISTRSASVSTSSRSWVISTAERPSRASTRRNTLRIAVAAADVQPGQRFVEQQYVGFGGQRAGQRDPLRLPAGQLARHAAGQVGRIDLSQPMLPPESRGSPRKPAAARANATLAATLRCGNSSGSCISRPTRRS